jgi:hypothetical protein
MKGLGCDGLLFTCLQNDEKTRAATTFTTSLRLEKVCKAAGT